MSSLSITFISFIILFLLIFILISRIIELRKIKKMLSKQTNFIEDFRTYYTSLLDKINEFVVSKKMIYIQKRGDIVKIFISESGKFNYGYYTIVYKDIENNTKIIRAEKKSCITM